MEAETTSPGGETRITRRQALEMAVRDAKEVYDLTVTDDSTGQKFTATDKQVAFALVAVTRAGLGIGDYHLVPYKKYESGHVVGVNLTAITNWEVLWGRAITGPVISHMTTGLIAHFAGKPMQLALQLGAIGALTNEQKVYLSWLNEQKIEKAELLVDMNVETLPPGGGILWGAWAEATMKDGTVTRKRYSIEELRPERPGSAWKIDEKTGHTKQGRLCCKNAGSRLCRELDPASTGGLYAEDEIGVIDMRPDAPTLPPPAPDPKPSPPADAPPATETAPPAPKKGRPPKAPEVPPEPKDVTPPAAPPTPAEPQKGVELSKEGEALLKQFCEIREAALDNEFEPDLGETDRPETFAWNIEWEDTVSKKQMQISEQSFREFLEKMVREPAKKTSVLLGANYRLKAFKALFAAE